MFAVKQVLTKMKPTPGSLSPFQTSSSNHDEQDDNYTEYYVKGGENDMENKTFDVNSSTTVDSGYKVNTSTEPDPNSEIAVQKEATYTKPAKVEGEGTYSTTANSRNTEPVAGSTTEPMTKAAECCDNACGKCKGPGCGCCADCKKVEKAADSCDCGKEDCSKCMGMKKAAACDCGKEDCPECSVKKETTPSDSSGGSAPSYTATADEDEDDLKKNTIQKSVWGGAFSPFVKR